MTPNSRKALIDFSILFLAAVSAIITVLLIGRYFSNVSYKSDISILGGVVVFLAGNFLFCALFRFLKLDAPVFVPLGPGGKTAYFKRYGGSRIEYERKNWLMAAAVITGITAVILITKLVLKL